MIPGSPSVVEGGDSVRGRDGTTCKQGTYHSPTLDFGITANNLDSYDDTFGNFNQNRSRSDDVGVYARVVIPLGNNKIPRVDCTQLYQLEIQRLQMELERMQNQGSSSIVVR